MSPAFPISSLLVCFCLSVFITHAQADQSKDVTKEADTTVIGTPPIKPVEDLSLRPAVVESKRKLVEPAFLRNRLPESAIAYLRLPNVWGTLGTPSGNVLDPVVGSKAFVSAASKVKEGFAANLIPEFPQESRLLLQLVMQYASSPLEVAILKNADSEMPVPNGLLTAGVDFESVDAVKAVFTKLAETTSAIKIIKPMDESGFSEIETGRFNGQVFWNKEMSRIFIFLGVDSTSESFVSFLQNLSGNDSHLMLTAEKGIDESGQGLFLWLNPPQIVEVAKKLDASMGDLAPFVKMGVSTMKSAALGAGTHNGINRLKLAVDMPVTGFRALIPDIKSNPTFNLNGKTSLVATLGLPTKSHILTYETMVSMGSPDSMKDYREFKEDFAKSAGFNLEDIFDFFGQDLNIVSGETGTYIAVRLNNEEAFNTMLEKSVKDFELAYEKREIAGHLYHHLKLPNLAYDDVLKAYLQKGTHKLAKRMLSAPTHLYWEQEGDYLLIANLPQILMARHDVTPSVPANKWLEDKQRIDSEGALMMISAVSDGVPQSVYRTQLSMLSYFGDLTERPVDLFELPTSRQAKLPKSGSYGLKLTSSDTQLAVELNYENNPFELFGGSTYSSTAVIGLAGFLGVAAQEEYEMRQGRAKLIPGIAAAKKVTKALDEYNDEYGSYPGQTEIDALELETETDLYAVSIDESTGSVVLEFNLVGLLGDDRSLTLAPPSEGASGWTCESDIEDKFLPKSCR